MGDKAVEIIDLAGMANGLAYGRPIWSTESEDFNLNLAVLAPGQIVDEHVNHEVDVLLIQVSGSGIVSVDGVGLEVGSGQAVLIPKETARMIEAGDDDFGYLLCHRRRRGLWPQPPDGHPATSS